MVRLDITFLHLCKASVVEIVNSFKTEAVWPSGYGAGIIIWWPQVQVPPWPLAGFILDSPEFKSLTLVNS